MAPGKTAEDWIAFLLQLIDHTDNFKPNWNAFAEQTGKYKSGKFVQAYDQLRKKYAHGDFGDGSTSSVPATPTGKKRARKAENNDDDQEEDAQETAVKPKSKRVKKEEPTDGEDDVHEAGVKTEA